MTAQANPDIGGEWNGKSSEVFQRIHFSFNMFLGPESKASYYLGIKDIKIGELRPHPEETGGLYFQVL